MGNTMQDEVFMKKAIELSKLAVEHGNEPFGAVLVKDGKDRKSTRLNSSHLEQSRMPSSA